MHGPAGFWRCFVVSGRGLFGEIISAQAHGFMGVCVTLLVMCEETGKEITLSMMNWNLFYAFVHWLPDLKSQLLAGLPGDVEYKE